MLQRPTILLTGFGPFPTVPANVTTELVPLLAEAVVRRFRSHRVEAAILPTEWVAGPRDAVELIEAHRPAIALHFGVASRARGFEIEVIGRNRRSSAKDAAGIEPPSPCLIENAPDMLPAGLPVARIISRLRRLGIPAHMSRDAGGYLCNAVLYHSLHAQRQTRLNTCSGFVHIPEALLRPPRRRWLVGPCPLDWEQALAGAMEIVATCVGQPATA